MDNATYKKSIKSFKRKGEINLCCSVCGEDNPGVIEIHHLNGKNISDNVVPLCKNCHTNITLEQNKLSPKVRSNNASPLEKIAYGLISIGALLQLTGEQLIRFAYEMIQSE